MLRTIEVTYEDNVLKPLAPIEGLQEHQRILVILCPKTPKGSLRKLAGTLTHEEAEAMRRVIDEEFERDAGMIMSQRLKAVYRKGNFLPQEPCDVPEGSEVELTIEGPFLLSPEVREPKEQEHILRAVVERM